MRKGCTVSRQTYQLSFAWNAQSWGSRHQEDEFLVPLGDIVFNWCGLYSVELPIHHLLGETPLIFFRKRKIQSFLWRKKIELVKGQNCEWKCRCSVDPEQSLGLSFQSWGKKNFRQQKFLGSAKLAFPQFKVFDALATNSHTRTHKNHKDLWFGTCKIFKKI